MNPEVPTLHQYLFGVNPSPEISEKVIGFKHELESHIGEFSSLHSEPHITIGTITLSQLKEEMLLERIQYVCAHTKPFSIALDGFGSFKLHTVYVRLMDSQAVRVFMSACESSCEGLPSKKGWQPKAKNPHLTIGRELGSNFKQSKQLFEDSAYQSRFEVNQLRIMRRELGGKYHLLSEIAFH